MRIRQTIFYTDLCHQSYRTNDSSQTNLYVLKAKLILNHQKLNTELYQYQSLLKFA